LEDGTYEPRLVFIAVQKSNSARFPDNNKQKGNPLPGLLVDTTIASPQALIST
jgi:hypothetical protein